MNKDPLSATHWKGRILLYLKAEDAKYPQQGKELAYEENSSDEDTDEDETKGKKDDEKKPLLKKEKETKKVDANFVSAMESKSAFEINN
jgi:hypothetical protein